METFSVVIVVGLAFLAAAGAVIRVAQRRNRTTHRGVAADPARIAALERELGMAPPIPPTPPAPAPVPSPRRLPDLQGTTAAACRLPRFTRDDTFSDRYGYTMASTEDRHNLAELGQALNQLQVITQQFATAAHMLRGPAILESAQASLRRIDRLEEGLVPLFAGLTFASYGRAARACIDARARIGNTLDELVIAGRL